PICVRVAQLAGSIRLQSVMRIGSPRVFKMSFCDNCFKGDSFLKLSATHPSTGKMEKLGGIQCYIATPTVDYPKDKVVLLLTDVFGLALNNNLLLADDFARNGFKTVVPDLFNGHPVGENAFEPNAPPFDREKWLSTHGAAQTRPPIDSVIATPKAEGVTGFAATGYCFGARYVVDLALLEIPADLEKYAAVCKAPLLVNSCTIDQSFPLEAQAQADRILGEGKFAPGYKHEYFEGCAHGFAVRGDMSDSKVKAGKEGAFKACVDWFLKYL
ncbi:dienelactone hydrolase endo-1,3,1,4-beta-D-glucanase, partial [Mycena vulgaris]